ncbi:MAG: helix-turn-helix transcriptional regulator [Paracoccaceae bacterium]
MATVKKNRKTSSAVPHIERLLIERNVQKSQLATALGVSNAVVTALLKGTRSLLAKDVPALTKVLGQNNEYWFSFIAKDNDDTSEEESLCIKFDGANGKEFSLFHPKIEGSEDAEAKALYMAKLIVELSKEGLEPKV